jgi:hypothetical protein
MQRRSSDGYISATGMYKAAFPWSTLEEETHERRHHKGLPSGKGEEVAGNVWIAPEDGMFLTARSRHKLVSATLEHFLLPNIFTPLPHSTSKPTNSFPQVLLT